MANYQSNSDRSKESKPEKKVEKVVTGTTKIHKKSGISQFTSSFLQRDIDDVWGYLKTDVIIPHAKKAISDLITNAIDMLLYGDVRTKGRNTNASKVSYQSFYDRGRAPERRDYHRANSAYSFDDILFDNRGDAEEVLATMIDIIKRYDFVTVFDLHEMAGVPSKRHTDNKYGWMDLSAASVARTMDGFILKLPKPMPFDD